MEQNHGQQQEHRQVQLHKKTMQDGDGCSKMNNSTEDNHSSESSDSEYKFADQNLTQLTTDVKTPHQPSINRSSRLMSHASISVIYAAIVDIQTSSYIYIILYIYLRYTISVSLSMISQTTNLNSIYRTLASPMLSSTNCDFFSTISISWRVVLDLVAIRLIDCRTVYYPWFGNVLYSLQYSPDPSVSDGLRINEHLIWAPSKKTVFTVNRVTCTII